MAISANIFGQKIEQKVAKSANIFGSKNGVLCAPTMKMGEHFWTKSDPIVLNRDQISIKYAAFVRQFTIDSRVF